jgi:hypothetical protein
VLQIRIRIRIEVKNRVRIRINVMRIRNTLAKTDRVGNQKPTQKNAEKTN